MSSLKTAKRHKNKTKEGTANKKQRTSNDNFCEKIRERAYSKWETAGCPYSDGVEFWLQAEAEVSAEMQLLEEVSKT